MKVIDKKECGFQQYSVRRGGGKINILFEISAKSELKFDIHAVSGTCLCSLKKKNIHFTSTNADCVQHQRKNIKFWKRLKTHLTLS